MSVSISLSDIEQKKAPLILEDFMSSLYCDMITRIAKTSPQHGGLVWSYNAIVDDFMGNLKREGKVVYLEDERTEQGYALSHRLSSEANLSSPVCMRLAEHYGEHILPVVSLVLTYLKDASFDRQKYHPPRISEKEEGVQTLTLFLNDTDGEIVVFDRSFVGALPTEVVEEHRYPCKKGTAIITDASRFYTTVPPSSEDMVVLQIHHVPANDAKKKGIDVTRSL